MIYTVKAKPNMFKTKQTLETAEMQIFCRMTGKILHDRRGSEDTGRLCELEN